MSHEDAYNKALEHLSHAYIQKILSAGENAQSKLTKLTRELLRAVDPSLLLNAFDEYALLERHIYSTVPSKPGMYLKLYHGRKTADEALDNWGPDGPWVGPLKWFYCTHDEIYGIGFADGKEITDLSSRFDVLPPILFEHQMIYLNGMYYGDWELVQLDNEEISRTIP